MTRDEILSMAREAEIGDSHGHFIRHELQNLERFAALVAAKVIARTPPPPMVAAPDDSGVMRLGKLWSQARAVQPDDPARQNASFLAALGVFEELVTAAERAARIEAQQRLADLQEQLVRADAERCAAVIAAVAAELEACEERVVTLYEGLETPYLPDITRAIRARGAA